MLAASSQLDPFSHALRAALKVTKLGGTPAAGIPMNNLGDEMNPRSGVIYPDYYNYL